MPFFASHGFKLHYEEFPRFAPEDVIFLHGNVSANVWWHPTVQNWKKEGDKSLLLMEWRGCGKSQGPNSEADLEIHKLADDVITLAETRNRPVNLVGHSTGGIIALHALAKRPELFRKAVLLDPVGASGLPITPEIEKHFERMRTNPDLTRMVILATIHGGVEDEKLKEEIVASACGIHPLNWQGILAALKNQDFSQTIRTIQHPVLILHGEFDALIPMANSIQVAQLLSHGTFQKLAGRGHSANVEDPKLFAEIARQYLFG